MRAYASLLLLTACAADSTPPGSSLRVVAVTPAPDAMDVMLDTPITLELSGPAPADFAAELTALGEPIEHATTIDGNMVTLTPAEPLWIATGYDVAVTLDEPFASRFGTRDGTWKNLPMATMSSVAAAAPLGSGAAPSLASLPDGTVLAGWEGGSNVYDQRFTPQSGWQMQPSVIDISADPTFVRVAAASPTRAVMAYERYTVRNNVDARTFDGTRWSTPVEVANAKPGTVSFDQYIGGVATTDQTHAIVFHRGEFDIDHFDLFASIHRNGAWTAPFLVEDLAGDAANSVLASDGRGGYVVAWMQKTEDRLSTAIWMRTIAGDGTLGAPQKLDDGKGDAYGLTITRGGDTVWIAWTHQLPDTTVKNRMVLRPFTASGLGTERTIAVDGFFRDGWLQLAANDRGNALVVYAIYGGVFASTANAGSWSPFVEVQKIPMALDEVGRPALALDARDNATIVWTNVPQSGRRVTVVSRMHAGGAWSAPAQLDEGTRSTYAWSAGVDAAGRVTTVWTQYYSTGYSVWGAHLQ